MILHPFDAADFTDQKGLDNILWAQHPELAGFVFWSDSGYYNIIGNNNGPELMASPKTIILPQELDSALPARPQSRPAWKPNPRPYHLHESQP
ncbi:MAG: hypothetical protein MUE50_05525 [Pirellulaceae bacterium]|jgi:hypothetical protein|nr:hypothetical protein [Pirellulaceae bacterium]